jgi:hypothetical protein
MLPDSAKPTLHERSIPFTRYSYYTKRTVSARSLVVRSSNLAHLIWSIQLLEIECDMLYFLTHLMADSNHLSVLNLKKRSGKAGSDREQEKNFAALCALVALGVSTAGLIVSILTLNAANTIANKPMPTLVQTVNGKTMEIKAFDGKVRSERAIQDFTVKTLTNLFTWRVYLIPSNQDEMRSPKADPGVAIESDGTANLKLPSPVWGASFAISDDFRKDFLGKQLAPLITTLKVLQGSSEVAFVPVSIQDPIEIKTNKPDEKLWKVKIVANLAVRTAVNVPETLVPFNKDVYIRAVIPPIMPDVSRLDSKTDLQAVTAIARSAGLEIYGMEDFSKEDLIK